ncbi:MAG: efflux RND transporter permease subunit, partial [Planctomycetes bacterium]|nr:efflux RND transporter permease subunit [Planctomycetota bacterium]
LAVAAGSAAGYLLLRLDSELIPEVHQGEFTVEIRLPRATRIEETDRVIRPWEQRILAGEEFADIASLTTTIGVEKDELTSGDEGEHSAELLVRLKPTSEPLRTERRVTSRIRDLLRDAEFESVDIVHPVLFTFKTPVEVEVSGYDLETLGRIVEQIRAGMEGIPEVKDVRTNLARGNPEVQVRLDRELLSRYSLGSPSSVGDVIRRKFQGDVASYFAMGDRKVPIRTRLQEADRDSLGELRDIRLSAPAERDLRLRDVVRQPGAGGESSGRQLPVGEGPAEIRRISHQRAGVINANLSGMSLGTAIAKVERVIDGIRDTMPPEFTVGFGGQKEEMDSALESLKNALLLAIFLVYVVMAMQFESLLQPFIIIFSIPLALVGVVPVLYFLGKPLSIVVFIGMIVLAGIVVNNAIVLVDTANRLRRGGLPLRAALVQAGEIRLRPILMTTVTTVLGLFPLTGAVRGMAWLEPLFGSGQGEEIRAPLAITVIAGLVTSTILTLVVIPVLASVADSALQRLRPRAAGGGGPA